MTERHNQARGANEWADTYGSMGAVPQAQLTQLPLHILDPWVDPIGKTQPFKPYSQDKLEELAENIRRNGVIEPICVRPMLGGRFQIIAGHNRVAASKLAGLRTIPALVQQLDDNQATILMVDSNLQHREKLLPSEKAFAYKMRLDAMNRQGQRNKATSGPMGQKWSRDTLAEESGESARQIQRYIRLTFLVSPLLEMVDSEKFAFRAAVEISYLDEDAQAGLLLVMEDTGCKAPSMAQAAQLRKVFQDGELDEESILTVMVKFKPPKVTTVKLPAERISSFFPPNTSAEDMEREIYEALLAYRKNNQSPVSV